MLYQLRRCQVQSFDSAYNFSLFAVKTLPQMMSANLSFGAHLAPIEEQVAPNHLFLRYCFYIILFNLHPMFMRNSG
ncbi:MAG: hypothetical protein CSA33_02760 [Desulfobulbus propionicus]|nr:MAG: hypothetical protein CSA33_02760 [Desulfobulbus propionicus]